MMGSDISYKCISPGKYEITAKIYRDCRGIPLHLPDIFAVCGSTQRYIRTRLVSVKDITPSCEKYYVPCDSNTSQTREGVEEHTYVGTVDLNTYPYSELTCCNIRFSVSQCCRNGAINTAYVDNFYTYAELNRCLAPCNNSPTLTNIPISYICCNQPFYFNMGGVDNVDYDSISYKFSCALASYSRCVYLLPPFTPDEPMSVYCPTKPCVVDTGSNPPSGIYLNRTNGDIIFTPTRCNEVSIMVVSLIEWRKIGGKMVKIGEVRRDMELIVKNCPENNPPKINGPYEYDICAGSTLCFNVTTSDKPKDPLILDSVKISWNGSIPNATFTIIDSNARLQSGMFCWTPSDNDVKPYPHTFTVKAKDNNCPLNATSIRAFSIIVKPRYSSNPTIDRFSCGKIIMKSNPMKKHCDFTWTINSNNGFFKISKKEIDTVIFQKNGTYFIEHKTNNLSNCPTYKYDTVIVSGLPDIKVNKNMTICSNSGYIKMNGTPYGGNWKIYELIGQDYTTISRERHDYVVNSNYFSAQSAGKGVYKIEYEVDNGCVRSDFFIITIEDMPSISITSSLIEICDYDTISLSSTSNSQNGVIWITSGDGTFNNVNSKDVKYYPGKLDKYNGYIKIYVKTIPYLACPIDVDSIFIKVNRSPDISFSVNKSDGCEPLDVRFSLKIKGDTTIPDILFGLDYEWSFGDGTKSNVRNPIHRYSKSGVYDVKLKVSTNKGCDTIIVYNNYIKVYENPLANFSTNPDKNVKITLPKFVFINKSYPDSSTYIWTFGDGDSSKLKNPIHMYPSEVASYSVKLLVITENGCIDTMFKELSILPSITVYIPNAFTPDNNGPLNNDRFDVVGLGINKFEISIFNRWGEKIYQSYDINDGWDGKYMGIAVQQGVYVYIVKVSDIDDEIYYYYGTITLIR